MRTVVADASAVAALLFAEPDADEVARRFGDAALVAPALLAYELASVALKKARRRPAEVAGILEALAQLDRLQIRLVTVAPAACTETALTTGLTSYDAAYLWLARHLRAELVTLDAQLAAAARAS